MWTNSGETIYLHIEEPNRFRNLDGIPRADQTLADMLDQPWALEDLEKEDILVEERTSLKDIILDDSLAMVYSAVISQALATL